MIYALLISTNVCQYMRILFEYNILEKESSKRAKHAVKFGPFAGFVMF